MEFLKNNQFPIDKMGNNNLNRMFIEPVTENEVQSLIRNLKHCAGWDSISAAVLKSADKAIFKPATHVLNLSLTIGGFPREMEIARVILWWNIYRPVSVLPVFRNDLNDNVQWAISH